MKTTVNLRDDLLRRLKSRAALRGQSLGRYVEESLERSLNQDAMQSATAGDWIETLPVVSPAAVKDLRIMLDADDFRPVDEEMWK